MRPQSTVPHSQDARQAPAIKSPAPPPLIQQLAKSRRAGSPSADRFQGHAKGGSKGGCRSAGDQLAFGRVFGSKRRRPRMGCAAGSRQQTALRPAQPGRGATALRQEQRRGCALQAWGHPLVTPPAQQQQHLRRWGAGGHCAAVEAKAKGGNLARCAPVPSAPLAKKGSAVKGIVLDWHGPGGLLDAGWAAARPRRPRRRLRYWDLALRPRAWASCRTPGAPGRSIAGSLNVLAGSQEERRRTERRGVEDCGEIPRTTSSGQE